MPEDEKKTDEKPAVDEKPAENPAEPTQEVAVVNPNSSIMRPAQDVPDYLKDELDDWADRLRAEDIVIPRLTLMQALTPSVQDGPNNAGEIINSASKEIWIGIDEELPFYILLHYNEWIEWGDRDSNEGIKAQSLDPAGELAQAWAKREKRHTQSGKEVYRVTEYHNFIALFPHHGMDNPVIIPCCKSNHKHGKKLLGLMRTRASGRPQWSGRYSVKCESETNTNNQKYKVFEFSNDGWIDEEHIPDTKRHSATMKDGYRNNRIQSEAVEEKETVKEDGF